MTKFFLSAREKKYRRDFESFIAGLSRAERAQYEKSGVDKPLGEKLQTKARAFSDHHHAGSFAESIGSFADTIGEFDAHKAAALRTELGDLDIPDSTATVLMAWHDARIAESLARAHADILSRTAAWFVQIKPKDMALEVIALAFVAHLDVVMALGSEADVARRLGITRSAVSKRVSRLRDELGYCVEGVARSQANRRACATAQTNGHWRSKLSWKKSP